MEKYEVFIDELLDQARTILGDNDTLETLEFLESLHVKDIAEILEEIEEPYKTVLVMQIPADKLADVLEEVNTDTFNYLLKLFNKEQRIEILGQMSDDDIADFLSELSEERSSDILNLLDIETRDDVKELMVYDEETAGGIMTKEFIAIDKDITLYNAIEAIREGDSAAETIYYVYVIDSAEKLVGVISLRDLIISKPNKQVHEIMNENVIYVHANDDQEEVAKVVSKYDLLAVPVVDDEGILRGIVTVDDVIDVIEEEASEDFLKFAGTSEEELEDDEFFLRSAMSSVRSRMPWLVITIFGGLLSASVIDYHAGVIDANTTLALFMPILAGMGGNVGTQSSTITVRTIALNNIYGKDVLRTILHEMLVGFFVGLFCSVIAAFASYFLKGEYLIALIVGVSMWVNMLTAATFGTIIPLAFKKLGIDPAVASAPFITTTIDVIGLSIYFTLATIMITRWL